MIIFFRDGTQAKTKGMSDILFKGEIVSYIDSTSGEIVTIPTGWIKRVQP